VEGPWGGAGGILRLGRLTVEHPERVAADFRELYGVSAWDIPTWEACLLVRDLLSDPRSRTAAAVAGWTHPVSREWMLLAQLHDVTLDTTHGLKNPERHHLPRPWDGRRTRLGGGKRTRSEALSILRPNGLRTSRAQ
jgi:hypothetical protein